MKLGFIGLGAMGAGIASNLARTGHALTVFDIRAESTQPLREAGATVAASVADLARDADVVFTSLPGPKEMRAIGLDPGGLLGAMRRGSHWVDFSTNAPTVVREVAGQFREAGIALLDAPVSGRPAGARSGKLAIYVGGETVDFEALRGLFDAVGDKVLHVGPVGAGNTAKLVHNLISLVTRMALAEGMTLGVKAGLDPLALWHALRQGAIGRQRTFDVLADQYLQDRFEPASFALRLAHKDFRLALDLARDVDVPMPQAETAFADYEAALARGWGEQDSRAPMKLQNERAGVAIRASAQDVAAVLARG